MNETRDELKGPVVAVVEGCARDRLVVDAGAAIAGATRAPLTLLRVAPLVEHSRPRVPLSAGWMQPWLIMRDQERALRESTLALAPRKAQMVVRFGDPVDQLTSQASGIRPSAVVAARSGQPRDRRLANAFGARLELVGTAPTPLGRRLWDGLLDQLAGGRDSRKIEALSAVSVFSHLPRRQIAFIARHLDAARVDAGTVLIKEGQRNATFWIVRRGEVEVTVRGRTRRRIGPHGFFGAISMLDGREASSTVVALTPVSAYVAGPAQFRALEGNEIVGLRLKADAEERLRDDQLELARELATAR